MGVNGKKIKIIRKLKGFSLYALQLETDVDRATIKRIEDGKIINPHWNSIQKIADFFEMSLDEFKI